VKRLLVKFPDESKWRENGFILNPNLSSDKKRIQQLQEMGLEIKLECLRNEDFVA
jgi:hypothetical protein